MKRSELIYGGARLSIGYESEVEPTTIGLAWALYTLLVKRFKGRLDRATLVFRRL